MTLKILLAIDPGIRYMGIAFLEVGKLFHYLVKTIKDHNKSPHKRLREARKIILRLIRDFRSHVLVYEKTFFAQNRNAFLLNVLVDEIKAIGRGKKLRVI